MRRQSARSIRRTPSSCDDGYIFVLQDIRGRYKSEGRVRDAPAIRATRRDPKAIDESTDTYDTIEWLLKNVPHNNGRVGMLGVSYPGWLTVMSRCSIRIRRSRPYRRRRRPRSCSSATTSITTARSGSSYGFEYAAMMEASKERHAVRSSTSTTPTPGISTLGSLANVEREVPARERCRRWNDFVEHPNYDAFWQREALTPYLDQRHRVPTLNVAGWWDQEDFYGPVTIYRAAREARHEAPELSRRRPVESRRLERRQRAEARQHRFRERDVARTIARTFRRRGSPIG